MMNSNIELQFLLRNFPIFTVFHGDGYNQEWVKHCDLPNAAIDGTDKAEAVRKGRFYPLNKEQADLLIRAKQCGQL